MAEDYARKAELMVRFWGERIARRRKELIRADGEPWSQQDLADALDTDQAQVSKWERGIQEPKLATKYALADVLGVSADVLFPTYP